MAKILKELTPGSMIFLTSGRPPRPGRVRALFSGGDKTRRLARVAYQ